MPAKDKVVEDTPTVREWQNERGWVIQLLVHPNRSSAILVRHSRQGEHVLYKVYDYWELNRATQDVELLASLGECEEVFRAQVA